MLFKRKSIMCDNCKNIRVIKRFPTPDTYLSALEQVRVLLASGNYEIEFATCPIGQVKDENGYWYDDLIAHRIKCKQCGTSFICSCDTYHGRGRFEKTK